MLSMGTAIVNLAILSRVSWSITWIGLYGRYFVGGAHQRDPRCRHQWDQSTICGIIFLGLHALALSWSRPDAIGGYCITGVAAINISGETIARLVFQFKLWGMTDALRKRYQSKRALILDEVSMLKWGDLRAVDMFCRALTRRPNVPFGGMAIVGGGDFANCLQLAALIFSFDQEAQVPTMSTGLTSIAQLLVIASYR